MQFKTLRWLGLVISVLVLTAWLGTAFFWIYFSDGATFKCHVAGGVLSVEWNADMIAKNKYVLAGRREIGLFRSHFGSWRNLRFWSVGPKLVSIGLAVPSILLTILTAGLWTWSWRSHRPPGVCRKCRYNLEGNMTGVCPECGTEIRE